MPINAQSPNGGGGSNPPAPKGTPGGDSGEESLPIDDYISLFFIVGITLGAYFISKSKSVVK